MADEGGGRERGATGHVLEIRRTFAAPPERVFEAFRNPALLKEWAAPREHRNESVEVEFREGGRYRREMRFPDGSLHVLSGTYLEIDPPRRLVYTFVWETLPLPPTRVQIELEPREGGTELRVLHSGFDDAEQARDHQGGWAETLDRLGDLLGPAGGAGAEGPAP